MYAPTVSNLVPSSSAPIAARASASTSAMARVHARSATRLTLTARQEDTKVVDDALFSSERDDWSTPQVLVDHMTTLLLEQYNTRLLLDVCATENNRKCSRYIFEDSLEASWHHMLRTMDHAPAPGGGMNLHAPAAWMNPPYGRGIYDWVQKAYDESCLCSPESYMILALLPARTDTKWWHEYVHKAQHIFWFKGRLYFDGHENGAPFPSAMALFKGKGFDVNTQQHTTLQASEFKGRRPVDFGLRRIRVRRTAQA